MSKTDQQDKASVLVSISPSLSLPILLFLLLLLLALQLPSLSPSLRLQKIQNTRFPVLAAAVAAAAAAGGGGGSAAVAAVAAVGPEATPTAMAQKAAKGGWGDKRRNASMDEKEDTCRRCPRRCRHCHP